MEVITIAGTKLAQKMRFLPYFPFGICSRLATTIEGMDNQYATRLLLGSDPDTTIALCDNRRKNTLDRSRYLCEKKYAKESTRNCGTPPVPRRFRYLTKLGLTIIIDAPDEAATDDTADALDTSANNGIIKGDHFRSVSMSAEELRDLLHYTATSNLPADKQLFQETLLQAVIDGRVTPLTSAIALAEVAKTSTSKYSQNQQLAIGAYQNQYNPHDYCGSLCGCSSKRSQTASTGK